MRNFGQSQSQQQQQWWQCSKENQNLVHRLIPQIFIIFGIFYHTNCISIFFYLQKKSGPQDTYLIILIDLVKKCKKTLILALWLCFFFGLVSLRFMFSGDWAGIKMWVQFFSRTGFRIMVQYQCPKLILIPA